jgi:signal transduction histidine kinase
MVKADPPVIPELTLAERELFDRLGWFTHVRWAAGILSLVFLALGWYVFDVRFAWRPATATIVGLFGYNLFFHLAARALRRGRRIDRRTLLALAHAQIACDLLAVAALVHFIGGVENHFILLFIFPMVVASEFFRPRIAYAYAALAALLVNLLGWGEYLYFQGHHPLQVLVASPVHLEPLVAPGAAQHPVFVLQVCFVMTFAVFATVFIASSIAGRLRSREEELEDAYKGLKSLEQVKSQFMRKTSHELRAPIGAVQSLLKAAEQAGIDAATGRDLVQRAIRRSENMLDLIDDLLRYSRLQGMVAQERFGPVDLAEIVQSSAELFRAQADEKGVRLDAETHPARVLGARENLADLVNNLVSNAIRYTPGGGRVTVDVGCRDGHAHLTVSDTGIGIPPDEMPRLFGEFFRGQQAKQAVPHGTGLGLAIVKRVVDMHGGRIAVESKPGQGTVFHVVLPPCMEGA